MFRLSSLFLLLTMSGICTGITVYESKNGKLYYPVDSNNGPTWQLVTVLKLGDKLPDDKNPKDRFGLIAVSQTEAIGVVDEQKDLHGGRLEVGFNELARLVEGGSLPANKLGDATEIVFKQSTSPNTKAWQRWRDKTKEQFDKSDIKNKQDAAQGLRDIATGVSRAKPLKEEIDLGELLRFFVEVILPLIIKLIGGGG